MKCKRCNVRMRKTTYRHCEDCGHEGRKRKCTQCGGRLVRETYYTCPHCGRTN